MNCECNKFAQRSGWSAIVVSHLSTDHQHWYACSVRVCVYCFVWYLIQQFILVTKWFSHHWHQTPQYSCNATKVISSPFVPETVRLGWTFMGMNEHALESVRSPTKLAEQTNWYPNLTHVVYHAFYTNFEQLSWRRKLSLQSCCEKNAHLAWIFQFDGDVTIASSN